MARERAWNRECYLHCFGTNYYRYVRYTRTHSLFAYRDGTWVVMKRGKYGFSNRVATGSFPGKASNGRLVLAKRAADAVVAPPNKSEEQKT
jgi:hypothetical protein